MPGRRIYLCAAKFRRPAIQKNGHRQSMAIFLETGVSEMTNFRTFESYVAAPVLRRRNQKKTPTPAAPSNSAISITPGPEP